MIKMLCLFYGKTIKNVVLSVNAHQTGMKCLLTWVHLVIKPRYIRSIVYLFAFYDNLLIIERMARGRTWCISFTNFSGHVLYFFFFFTKSNTQTRYIPDRSFTRYKYKIQQK